MVELREMDRRSWLWRRKSAEKTSGDTESSGSLSSHSERYSDDQETSKLSPNHVQSQENSPNGSGFEVHERVKSLSEKLQSAENSPESEVVEDERVKNLREKLSAALLNISAKEDLVKQHAKVAEEAVSGWEKAETEAAALKQQLEARAQQNSVLEDRASHLDGALKECVRELRQAREEQEQKIHEAVLKKTRELEASKFELENQLGDIRGQLQATKSEASAPALDPTLLSKLETLEKENASLKRELFVRAEELEMRTLELELSTQAAETASKQHLESIKKATKLEAECRRLRAVARKASTSIDPRAVTGSSAYVESLTDSQSDSGDRFLAVETEIRELHTSRKSVSLESYEGEPSCSGSWASALIAELAQFKNEKLATTKNSLAAGNIDLMDDFLEMERLAALPEIENGNCGLGTGADPGQSSVAVQEENSLLKTELEDMRQTISALNEKVETLETAKTQLEKDLDERQDQVDALQSQLTAAEQVLVVVREQLASANDSKVAAEMEIEAADAMKKAVEVQLEATNMELRRLYAKVGSLESEVEEERSRSSGIEEKCRNLKEQLQRRKLESESSSRATAVNGELKIKQEKELAAAAGKFAECQRTIASLGRQLKALSTVDDFMLDADKQELNGGSPVFPSLKLEKLYSDDSCSYVNEPESSRIIDKCSQEHESHSSSSSSSSSKLSTEKTKNGFGKLFSRSRNSSRTES